jgi:hypothetical protein
MLHAISGRDVKVAESLGFYTQAELRTIGRRRALRENNAPATLLRRYALRATSADRFDVFLSHSYADATTILGVYELLDAQGVSVYVDWIVDHQLDRTKVNRDTADTLRQRMRQCRSLIYAVSTSSRSSIWMPWELGYFDGMGRNNRISIMPIDEDAPGNEGQEYLDLYPAIEKVTDHGRTITAAVEQRDRNYVSVQEFALGLL